ncbi:MAG TPA: hypothetical protein VHL80_14410 [Polyangia bacterium]|nr:hypothetical protein [Polyangia bacterium]
MTRGARVVVPLLAAALLAGVGCKHKAKATGDTECLSNAGCPVDQFCTFTPGLCGRGPRPGVCRPRPLQWPQTHAPVCGCDGKVYENETQAHMEGVDLAVTGGCQQVIVDWAPCGPRFCDARTSYCEIYLSDVFEIPTTYNCRALPQACLPGPDGFPERTCDCFPASTPCKSFCGPLPTGGIPGFHLTCQGVKEPRQAPPRP